MAGSKRSSRAVGHVALGRIAYEEALALQREIRERRVEEAIGDVVITLEHEPVFTVGRSGSLENLLVPRVSLDERGISIVHVERGGDITYHGPGQLVVYPIVDLRDEGRDIKGFILRLEETILRVLADFGVHARRHEGRPGAWVGGRKIASIGIHVRRWITMHGVAINLDVDRTHFAMIRPCGLPVEIVSIRDLTGESIDVGEAAKAFARAASEVFGWTIRPMALAETGARGG